MGVPGNANALLLASAAVSGGYQVSRSLRFDSSASSNLSRTPASASNRKTFTHSLWVKRSTLGTTQRFLNARNPGVAANYVRFNSDNTIELFYAGTTLITAQVFRDVSAWYNILVAVDTTQATASNRVKLYINGVQVTTFGTTNYPGQDADTLFNSALIHNIGTGDGTSEYFDGYLAEVFLIDGQQLDPSSFTTTDLTTGQLIPKAYTGSYGTNGFKLSFSDNSTTAALGTDTSGNGNTWTVHNFSVTQGTGSYTTNTTGTFAANRGAIKAFDGATSGSDFYAQPADGNTVTIGSLGITGITKLRMWLGKNANGDPWGTLTLNSTNVTSFLTTNYPSANNAGQWIDLTAQLPGSSLSTITMTSPVANTDVRLSAVEVNDIVLIDRAAPTTAGNDSLVDTPTSYGTDTGVGNEVRGNYCTWNPLDNGGALTLTNGNLDAENTTADHDGCRATIKLPSSGKWYFEGAVQSPFTGTTANTLGVATSAAANPGLGGSGTYYILVNAGGTVQRYVGGSPTTYSGFSAPGIGSILQVAYNADTGNIWFGLNNTWMDGSGGATGNPSTGSNPTITGVYDVFPATSQYSTKISANWGARSFAYTAPSGFKALVDTNLPTPVVAKPNTVMDVALWSGNGGSQTITLPGAFSPDFVWIKRRSSSFSSLLYDTVRGNGPNTGLISDSTTAEGGASDNATYGYLNAFNSTGFALTAGSSSDYVNTSGQTYVGWAWDAGAGSPVTNNAGTVSGGSLVKANPSAGFSIVTYTVGSNTSQTIGHGLGVAPQLLLVKERNQANNWQVYHASLGNGNFLYLNGTNASAANNLWNNTSPTSTVFSIRSGGSANFYDGKDQVCYAFAPVSGYSSFGTWTGAGTTNDQNFIYTGFRPRFIMVKCTDAGEQWFIFDSARRTYNMAYPDITELRPNSSGAEGSYYNLAIIDFLSNGFKIRGNTGSEISFVGRNYIYCAWAESPFQYARAR